MGNCVWKVRFLVYSELIQYIYWIDVINMSPPAPTLLTELLDTPDISSISGLEMDLIYVISLPSLIAEMKGQDAVNL